MEIANYIGQFILKNNFCYIHGLGNLELVKRPAAHDGKALNAPYYEVIVTSGGSIDDSFANFIATNEQISISKAANSLREFSIQARKDMQAGKEVILPGIGKFVEENGKVKFFTDPNFRFTPAGIPVLKNSKQLEEQKITPLHEPSYPRPAKASSVNWSMVTIAIVFLVILGAGGYGFYYYKYVLKDTVNAQPVAPPVFKDTVVKAPAPVVVDTLPKKDTIAATTAAPVVDTVTLNNYKVVIGEYANRAKAEQRFRQLKINGNKVELLTKDSINYKVLTNISCRVIDTLHFRDSLGKLFGYKNAVIYKP